MVNLRSGAVVGIGVVVLGVIGWIRHAPETPATNNGAFQTVQAATPDLSVPDTVVSDASVASHPTFKLPDAPAGKLQIRDAAKSIPTLTPAVATQPADAATLIDYTPAATSATTSTDALPEPFEVAQYVPGDPKQACTVAFATVPPISGGAARIEATRTLEIMDVGGAINVVERRWILRDAEGVDLEPGENATFDWLGHTETNPLILQTQPIPNSVRLVLEEPGDYTLILQVTTASGDMCTDQLPIVVSECVDPPGASFDLADAMGELNNVGVLPLQDWMPLFQFTMTAEENEGEVARRSLGTLNYVIGQGPVFFPDIDYENDHGPSQAEILEFGMFFDSGPDGDPDGILNEFDSGPILTWANDGFPYGTVDDTFGSLVYTLDFFQGADAMTGLIDFYDSQDNEVPEDTLNDNGIFFFNYPMAILDTGAAYIVGFRSSAAWRTGTTLSYGGVTGFMVNLDHVFDEFTGEYYDTPGCGEDGESVDTYPDEPLTPEDVQYSSVFTAFDATGHPLIENNSAENTMYDFNLWNWSNRVFTPLGEHVRPRFDGVSQTFDMVLGEFLDLRTLFALETWYPVVGLNMHAATNPFVDPLTGGAGALREVNMVFTDIGGDPDDPNAGNGGFDPRQGFDRLTNDAFIPGDDFNQAINFDYSFNGVWVFYDTNNNGQFDQPTKSASGGVVFTDHPMLPSLTDEIPGMVDAFEPGWSYIPNPAWGGDPAFKIRLRFNSSGQRRRNPGDEPIGTIEPIPDVFDLAPFGATISEDYFIVIRADSGFQDVSLVPGDGTGLDPAADFRAFIEPRNFNEDMLWWDDIGDFGQGLPPFEGGWDGGIATSLSSAFAGIVLEPNVIIDPWQNDPRFNWPYPPGSHHHSGNPGPAAGGENPEPWWPQRTHNWNNTKPQRGMVEIHDLVMLYDTNNELAKTTEVDYAQGGLLDIALGKGSALGVLTPFDAWMDPFSIIQSTFANFHTVGVLKRGFFTTAGFNGVFVISEDHFLDYQYSFETVPFFDPIFDQPPFGPRSPFYTPPHIPDQPSLPEYITWPPAQAPALQLPPGEYPQLSDWPQAQRAARLLKQHTDVLSPPVAMLGLNFTGADDPVTNRIAQTRLEEVTIAFWGPDFAPSDLLPLDRDGELEETGILLYQDEAGGGPVTGGVFDSTFGADTPVPLNNLAWRNVSEPVDLDGDGVSDDIDGDGTVDANDNCWVLRLRPRQAWSVPLSDVFDGETLQAGNIGDDLFVVVRTSESIRRFENFRVLVPSTLPSRSLSERVAGVKLAPNQAIPAEGIVKRGPEENAVQDWYGHDMLENNVPAAVTDLTTGDTTISPIDEVPTPVLGIDVSTNRPYNEAQPFNSAGLGEGTRGSGTMTVPGNPFSAGALIGDFVIDSNYEPFEITANTANTITFLSGTPAPGAWIIAREPSFLEQIIVEFYDEGNDGGFNLNEDLLLLNEEDPTLDPPILSGVAIYRDNDFHPDNTDGVFDPGIDIALDLDDAPVRIGVQGEPQQQVKFVFSSPGTDDFPTPIAEQPRLRQWVPDSWNEEATEAQSDPGESPDFFVVIRASSLMQSGDNFRVGLVSWGPNTPTEPDPDTFTSPPPPTQPQDEFDIFSEFPWGARALGFITFFKEQPFYYFWERTRVQGEPNQFIRAAQQQDITQFDWIRSTVNKSQQTGVITASTDGANIIINSVDPTELPRVVPEGGLVMRIDGRGFGGSPIVTIEDLVITPDSATDNSITITIPEGTPFDLPVVLTVENSETGEIATWTQFTIEGGGGLFITNVTPFQLPRIIPEGGILLTITGFGFGDDPNVTLGDRTLQVQSASDELITALLPAGLDLTTIELVLTVTNPDTSESDTFEDFEIVEIQLLTASPNVIPPFPPPSGINVRLGGTGFGDNPIVTFNGFNQIVIEASDTEILVGVTNIGAVIPGEFITVSVTNPDINATATRDDLIRVGNLPGEDAPTATLEVTDGIGAADKDGHALVPLNDWVPLFHISMTHGEDEFAPRVLSKLRYVITADNADERDYGRVAAPEVSDILDFALFRNFGAEDDDISSLERLDAGFDSILVGNDGTPAVWNNQGEPLGRLIQDDQGFLEYEIDFIGTGTPANPQFPVVAGIEPTEYIVAVRTSATWRSMTALGYDVLSAEMVDPDGNFPIDEEGAPTDEYTPDFFGEGETLDPDTGYSASFAVWDISGGIASPDDMSYFNQWTWPQHLYTPAAEHSRPRWDRAGTFVDFLSGEWLDLRNVFSLENWTTAVGINLHGTNAIHEQDPLRSAVHPRQNSNPSEPLFDVAYLEEVNLVITDIGADPNGPPGDGGFDPRTMLDPMVADLTGNQDADDEFAIGSDVTFNGLWIWYDSNNNGRFDPPTVFPFGEGGGVTFNGDYPMVPLFFDESLNFEYIPFPPTGGDPWWKINIQLDGVRRQVFTVGEDDNVDGALEPVPDQLSPFDDLDTASDYSHDYFVVYRADSGAQDASMRSGDGTSTRPGADFRVFVEPRRFNPVSGSTTGGIYVDSMIPGLGFDILGGAVWQDDIRWGVDEPWWNQRTANHNSAMPHRAMFDIHDLVMTYSSSSTNRIQTDIDLTSVDFGSSGVCFGYADEGNVGTTFDLWMDPFGLLQAQFLNRHSVFVWDDGFVEFTTPVFATDDGDIIELGFITDDNPLGNQFAYETTPFYIDSIDGPPAGPRVPTYPNPPVRPSLPTYSTWPAHSDANVYPRASDWDIQDRRARLLKQHVDSAGETTAMLGLNLAGVDDPVASRINDPKLASITVAIWGPDFNPDDLEDLDPAGTDPTAGVLLWEDSNESGVFEGRLFESFFTAPSTQDAVVPLADLAWPVNPELIDLDGDGIADDLNGDGLVDDRDRAWVLRLQPAALWAAPRRDVNDFSYTITYIGCGVFFVKDNTPETKIPFAPKALDVDAANTGDDLFITVRTSQAIGRFEQFRMIIPATLPQRPVGQRTAGIQLSPVLNVSPGGYEKLHPEEGPVQEFYGHDMLEANVPLQILDLTQANQTVSNNGGIVPVLGLDIATNREDATLAEGADGTGGLRAFTVQGATWGPGNFVGHFLIDSNYESFEITGNTANRLDLLSGAPANGRWRIVKDPTFLEQLIIEVYNESEEGNEDTDFNLGVDLLPIVQDMTVSGIAIYRDNDAHPNNTNGQFDQGIDIPLKLDGAPQSVATATGPENQFLFVFSSPGTDNVPQPRDQQLRFRQWVPDTFGPTSSSEFTGADFFIVVRASSSIDVGDDFRVGIVGWGPNTPTFPDPDTFLPGNNANIMKEFDEFPWGSRAVGFVTMLSEPQTNYYMEGFKTRQEQDASGFDFIRSGTSKKRRTFPIEGRKPPLGPNTIKIDSVSESKLPQAILPGETFDLVIYGDNFGTAPEVSIGGYDVAVTQATDEAINVSLESIAGVVPQEPVILIVSNLATKETGTRTDMFTLVGSSANAPRITSVSPNRGGSTVFPVTVRGSNFNAMPYVEVLFGTVKMDIVSATPTAITVSYPRGGFPSTGALDVTVRNLHTNFSTSGQHILVNGFTYQNGPSSGFSCSSAPAGGVPKGDAFILGIVLILCAAMWRKRSVCP